MRWRRTDPVQTVGALILVGPGAVERLAEALAGKAAAFSSLAVARGEAWAAVFAGPPPEDPGGEPILPRITGAEPLYEAEPGWWLPVGLALNAPDHLGPVLWRALGEHYGLAPPAIVAPRLEPGAEDADSADLYLIRHTGPLTAIRAAPR
jgi:hypothetical protein